MGGAQVGKHGYHPQRAGREAGGHQANCGDAREGTAGKRRRQGDELAERDGDEIQRHRPIRPARAQVKHKRGDEKGDERLRANRTKNGPLLKQ